MSRTKIEIDSYRITHNRITERNIPAPETRIVQSMSEMNSVHGTRATRRNHKSRSAPNNNIGIG